VSATSETINGTINPMGALTTGSFVYYTAGGAAISLTFPAGSDSSSHSFQTNLTGLTPNTTYNYLVTAYNSGGAGQGQVLSFTTEAGPQAPPSVTTSNAIFVTCSNAVVNGFVNGNGDPTTAAYFEWSIDQSTWTDTTPVVVGGGSQTPFSATLTGLAANQRYYFRIAAYNTGGATNGADAVFTTSSCEVPPTVQTLGASCITDTYALLNGLVNPNGTDTYAYWLSGTTTPPSTRLGGADVGKGSTTLGEVYALATLTPNTTYYYQIVASNVNGLVTYGGITNFTTFPDPLAGMVLIPAGSFTMGDTLDGEPYGVPTVSVYVSAFYMDQNLVTWSQWQSVFNWAANHGWGSDINLGEMGKGPNHPVQAVQWYNAVKWCNARSQMGGLTPVYYTDQQFHQVYMLGDVDAIYPNWSANGYRLPTEAEWEKAARGGAAGHRFPWTTTDTISESQANYVGYTSQYSYDLGPNGYNQTYETGGPPVTSNPYTSPVGSFAANGYGLYDMAGNVRQWCWDYMDIPYQGGTDPHGPLYGNTSFGTPPGPRVIRGGSWGLYAYNSRCAHRDYYGALYFATDLGFRCVKGTQLFIPCP
jgi:formylglycine-generating enzyme required for sulfatase activity